MTFLNYWNKNQTVNQGDLVFTVIPNENSSFIAKLKTPAQNSGKIKIGQEVKIKIENYPDSEFGVLNGTVKKISIIPDKEGFYIIDVELPKKLITSYKKKSILNKRREAQLKSSLKTLDLSNDFFISLKRL